MTVLSSWRAAVQYHKFDHAEMTIWEAFEHLSKFVDASDPDTEVRSLLLRWSQPCGCCSPLLLRARVSNCVCPMQHPNLVHMLQTAEAMRAAGHPDWFQLVGLLHDMGKLMFLWGDRATGQEARGMCVYVNLCCVMSNVLFPCGFAVWR